MIPAWAAGAGGLPSPEDARSEAESILDGRRFQPVDTPRPLRGVLEWIGDRLEPVGRFFSRIADWVADRGGSQLGLVIIAVALAAVASVIAIRVVRQRTAVDEKSRIDTTGQPLDPGSLESAAVEAEQAGDYDRALRLRFRAGLLRLDTVGAIRFRPSITSGEVARRVRQADFRALAGDFDEVAYGGRPAGRGDVAAARRRWPRVWLAAEAERRVESDAAPESAKLSRPGEISR